MEESKNDINTRLSQGNQLGNDVRTESIKQKGSTSDVSGNAHNIDQSRADLAEDGKRPPQDEAESAV